jgi:hypothetical protein
MSHSPIAVWLKYRSASMSIGAMLLTLCVGGCQFSYPFEINGVVTNAANGTPLPGVSVKLEGLGLHLEESPFPIVTDADGKFSVKFRADDVAFQPDLSKWSITLAKEGYKQVVLDVSQTRRPESATSTTRIVVASQMLVN